MRGIDRHRNLRICLRMESAHQQAAREKRNSNRGLNILRKKREVVLYGADNLFEHYHTKTLALFGKGGPHYVKPKVSVKLTDKASPALISFRAEMQCIMVELSLMKLDRLKEKFVRLVEDRMKTVCDCALCLEACDETDANCNHRQT